MKTDDQLVDEGTQLAKLYVAANVLDPKVEHAMVQAYRTGYRARAGEVVDRALAMKLVESVLNGRHDYHGLDDETRADLLGAIVDGARAEIK